jgi:hypothetical protein
MGSVVVIALAFRGAVNCATRGCKKIVSSPHRSESDGETKVKQPTSLPVGSGRVPDSDTPQQLVVTVYKE